MLGRLHLGFLKLEICLSLRFWKFLDFFNLRVCNSESLKFFLAWGWWGEMHASLKYLARMGASAGASGSTVGRSWGERKGQGTKEIFTEVWLEQGEEK